MLQLVLTAFILAEPATLAQEQPARVERQLGATVREYSLSAGNLLQALHKLASDFQLPMGIEWIRDAQSLHGVSLSWRDAPVHEVLQRVLAEYPAYRLEVDGRMIHVSRKEGVDGLRDPLSLRLGPFEVTDEWLDSASGSSLRWRVRHILRPIPAQGIAGSIGSGLGGDRRVSFKASNPTLREVLDGFALSAGQSIWVVTYPEFETTQGRFRSTVTPKGVALPEEEGPVWVFIPWGAEGVGR